MSKKTVDSYKRNRRTAKIVESLAERHKRQNELLELLDRKADEVLSGKHANKPMPTDDEIAEMRRAKPEVGEVLDLIFDVADKMK